MVTIYLSHSLSTGMIAALALPAGDYRSGQPVTTDRVTASRIINAGYATLDPTSVGDVTDVLDPAGEPTGFAAPGVWYVGADRLPVNLTAIRDANRTSPSDVYRISRASNGRIDTALWAPAGQQIPSRAITAAMSEASSSPVANQPLSTPGGTSAAVIDSAVNAAVNTRREAAGGLAGLDPGRKIFEARLPDRLSSTALGAVHTASRDRANHTGPSDEPIWAAFTDFESAVRTAVAAYLIPSGDVQLVPTGGQLAVHVVAGTGGPTDPGTPGSLSFDTDGVPYFDPTGTTPGTASIAVDDDGVPYYV